MRFIANRKLMVLVLAISLVASCGAKKNESSGKKAASGRKPAFAFQLVTLDGKKISLGDYKGKALIVDVWDTWCPPCRAEIPHFIDLYAEYKSKGLEILGVAGGRDGIEAVDKFIGDYGIKYPNAIATREFVEGFGGIYSIPTTFVIDQDGNIYQTYIGLRPKEVFEKDIKTILNL
jgi:peroxiredoxin